MHTTNRRHFGLALGLLGLSLAGRAAAASPPSASPTGLPDAPLARAPRLVPAQRTWTPPPAQAPTKEGLVSVGSAELAYWDTGGLGDPVVLLHPATGSKNVWAYQQPVLAAAGYRVIGYSRRGHAGSTAGTEADRGTGAGDLNAILDHLDVKRFHILGSAAGGFIVPDYAVSFQDRLLTLTIACSQAGIAQPEFRAAIQTLSAEGFSKMAASFRELGPSYRAAYPEGVAAWEALEHASRSVPDRIRQPTQNKVDYAALKTITVPALVFTGSADLYMPPSLMLQYARHLPNVETAILAEAGHSAYWEQPEAFNALVLDFLARHSSRKGLAR